MLKAGDRLVYTCRTDYWAVNGGIDTYTDEYMCTDDGVLNTPMVAKYCPATEVHYRMWLETVEEDGEEILQLQYEQIVFFEFSFFIDGSLTRWPHIQVNTLRKKKAE